MYMFWCKLVSTCTAQLGAPWWSTLRAASRSYWLFDFALPSEHENLSWIDWIIEISPSTRWVLFAARKSHIRASHHTTYYARRSLTSYQPVVHTCSHFCARVRRRHMLRKTARVPPQVPQYFEGVWANGFLFAPPAALISFILYGAD